MRGMGGGGSSCRRRHHQVPVGCFDFRADGVEVCLRQLLPEAAVEVLPRSLLTYCFLRPLFQQLQRELEAHGEVVGVAEHM